MQSTKYFAIFGGASKKQIGVTTDPDDVLREEAGATFEPITEEEYNKYRGIMKLSEFPKSFEAFILILRDGGGINRCEPEPTTEQVHVPTDLQPLMSSCEEGLKSLSQEEFITFCIGSLDDMEEIAKRSHDLETADHVLSNMFLEPVDWYPSIGI